MGCGEEVKDADGGIAGTARGDHSWPASQERHAVATILRREARRDREVDGRARDLDDLAAPIEPSGRDEELLLHDRVDLLDAVEQVLRATDDAVDRPWVNLPTSRAVSWV